MKAHAILVCFVWSTMAMENTDLAQQFKKMDPQAQVLARNHVLQIEELHWHIVTGLACKENTNEYRVAQALVDTVLQNNSAVMQADEFIKKLKCSLEEVPENARKRLLASTMKKRQKQLKNFLDQIGNTKIKADKK